MSITFSHCISVHNMFYPQLQAIPAKLISLYLFLFENGGKLVKNLFITVWISTVARSSAMGVWINQ